MDNAWCQPGRADGMVVVVMGAAGAGKSTVGRAVADELGWPFVDADDLHLPASVDRMRSGIPLTDEDRWPWLRRVRGVIESAAQARRPVVVACSALRETYRRYLLDGVEEVRLVYLRASADLLEARLRQRPGHFAAANLLQSQLDALEPPVHAVSLDASLPVHVLVAEIRRALTP